jgi:hypothetical protein
VAHIGGESDYPIPGAAEPLHSSAELVTVAAVQRDCRALGVEAFPHGKPEPGGAAADHATRPKAEIHGASGSTAALTV